MTQFPVVVDGVDYGDRLPRGRHGIPSELVVANQRERLLGAAAGAFAEVGYAALTVAAITARAGVSRATFYKLYDDKFDCVLAAQQEAFDRLSKFVVTACASARSWPEGVAAAVDAALRFGAESPAQLSLVLLSSHTVSEPRLARRALAVHEQLAELLRAGRVRHLPDLELPELTEQAVVGAAMSVVATRLTAGETRRLPELAPDLAQLVLAPYGGRVRR